MFLFTPVNYIYKRKKKKKKKGHAVHRSEVINKKRMNRKKYTRSAI